MKNKKRFSKTIILPLLAILITIFGTAYVFQAPPKEVVVAFYNIENLFDTEDDPNINDEDFLPESKSKWTKERYDVKLDRLSEVISQLGSTNAPDILGLCEVENKKVIEDLIAMPKLAPKKYGIVHYDSPDERGIDVALIYKKAIFTVFDSKAIKTIFPNNPTDRTRDILMVSGVIGGRDTLHLFVAHLPSRRGGQDVSESSRIFVAEQIRTEVDMLQKKSPKANILIMGDMNDEPNNKSMKDALKAQKETKYMKNGELFNAMGVLKDQGKGSYKHDGKWNMLDQIIVSKAMAEKKSKLYYVKNSAQVFMPEFLQEKEGKFKGNPFRTYAGTKYLGGYSDHFSVFVKLKRK